MEREELGKQMEIARDELKHMRDFDQVWNPRVSAETALAEIERLENE